MRDFKPFDPNDVDQSLVRVVAYGGKYYVLFLYIDALGPAPKFNSVTQVIAGPAATTGDLRALSALVRQAGENAAWFISFNTPWRVRPAEADSIKQRRAIARGKRD
jgi:hypothetical protein